MVETAKRFFNRDAQIQDMELFFNENEQIKNQRAICGIVSPNYTERPFEYYFEGEGLKQTQKEMAFAMAAYKQFKKDQLFEKQNGAFIANLTKEAETYRNSRKKFYQK